MKQNKIVFIILMLLSTELFSSELQYNVKDYGAKGDGISLETNSIQKAIDKATETGGGVVVVPTGTYKIGTLILKDNVNLHLQAGATLLGSKDVKSQLSERIRS